MGYIVTMSFKLLTSVHILVLFTCAFISCTSLRTSEDNLVCSTGTNKSSTLVALILARGGSKGVYKKNLQKIDGVSLLGRALNTLRKSELFSDLWVSTDSQEIADEAQIFGAKVHNRPRFFAKDKTSSIAAVKDFLKEKPANEIALIQCTSPFLRSEYIEEAYEKFKSADCVFAATRSYSLRWAVDKVNEYVKPLNFYPSNRPRRQDWNGELIETGMFYFFKSHLINQNVLQNEKCKVVLIPKEDSLEIDSYFDLNIARFLSKIRT